MEKSKVFLQLSSGHIMLPFLEFAVKVVHKVVSYKTGQSGHWFAKGQKQSF